MEALTQQRCLNHDSREAVARCPECRLFFCRECITEHDDRIICAACLKKLVKEPAAKSRRVAGLARLVQTGAGIFTVWLFFYLAGTAWLAMDSSFHESTLWKADEVEEE